jgi:N-acetylneuraminic acid mutarotase
MGISMGKNSTLLLVLVFLAASCVTIAMPTGASTEAAENTWTTKAPLPDGVSLVKAAVANGKIYVMTGVSVYEYDPTTDNWTAKTAMPTPRERSSFGIAAYQNKIYVIGGSNGTRGYTDYLSTNEVYDPLTDMWETKQPMPTSMIWVEANVINGKIYAMGVTMDEYHLGYIPVNEVYDPATDLWTTKQPAPIGVIKGASAVVDSNIFILGGLGDNNTLNAISNQIYDAENDTWSLGASLPTAMWYTAAGATAGVMAPKRIYIMGGGFTEITNVVNVYDPALNTWSSGAPLPTNRTGHAIAMLDDVLYVMGGGAGWHGGEPGTPDSGWTLTNVVEQYTPFGYGTIPPVTTIEPEPFPTTLVIAASGVSLAVIGIGLLVFKKRKSS